MDDDFWDDDEEEDIDEEDIEEDLEDEDEVEEDQEEEEDSDLESLLSVDEDPENLVDTDIKMNYKRKVMSKYEYATLLGLRAIQLAKGAPAYIDTTGYRDVLDIAKRELELNLVPLMVGRFTSFPRTTESVYYQTEDLYH